MVWNTGLQMEQSKPMFNYLNSLDLDSAAKEEAAGMFETLRGWGFDVDRMFNKEDTKKSTLGKQGPMSTRDKFDVGLGIADTGLKAYLGMKQLGLAKKDYRLQREAFNTNMANQKKSLNRQLSEEYRRSAFKERLAPTEDAYMTKWGY